LTNAQNNEISFQCVSPIINDVVDAGAMTDQRVLVLGGRGRIGSCVAQDVIAHTQATLTVTGRPTTSPVILEQLKSPRVQFLALDLADQEGLRKAIASHHLVIHCAGPFLYRDTTVLETCIAQGVNYIDVSDNREFTRQALACGDAAAAKGVTAIINTGIFPGISNSMVRHDVEQLDVAERIHLSYLVAGSGGAGVTVIRKMLKTPCFSTGDVSKAGR